jgi:MFS family permease
LADILGRKKLLLLGMIVFTLASALCGLSINAYMQIGCRVLQGISGATISVTVVSILTSAYSPGERGKVLGLNVAMTYTGLSSGPFIGGILADYLGWRSIFFASGLIGAIVAVLLLNLKQDCAEAKGEKFDYLGSLIYGIALFGIVLTFSSLAALINYSATSAISYLLSLYLQYIKGFSPTQAGFILIA